MYQHNDVEDGQDDRKPITKNDAETYSEAENDYSNHCYVPAILELAQQGRHQGTQRQRDSNQLKKVTRSH